MIGLRALLTDVLGRHQVYDVSALRAGRPEVTWSCTCDGYRATYPFGAAGEHAELARAHVAEMLAGAVSGWMHERAQAGLREITDEG